MYKFQSKQIGVTDFGMPLGVQLNPENRWVQKAGFIPWDEIEQRYAALFPSHKGNVAKPLRLALGALIVQKERNLSDEETPLQIQETPCLQYFCGMPAYQDALPFDASLMVYFRKRLTPEILGEINEMILAQAEKKQKPPQPPNDGEVDPEPSNQGTLIVDATCAPQNIRYPQDTSLLNEARENLEKMVDDLHHPGQGVKPRTYRRKAHWEYLNTAKKRQKTNKEIRSAVKKQLGYVRRNLEIVDRFLADGKTGSDWQEERLQTIRKLYDQQWYIYQNHTHQVEDRIVSLGQPWIRPIVRGKAKAKCEFGAKLDISVSNGWVRLEHTSFDAYNESENLIDILERYRMREGYYPERVLADGIYRNRKNRAFCKEHGIRMLGKPLGRPKKEDKIDKQQARLDEIDRIEVERKFSYAKGSFGLGLIRSKLKETSQTSIALSIVVLNLAHIEQIFLTLLQWMVFHFCATDSLRKCRFVQ